MKLIRIISDICVVLATTVLLITIGNFSFDNVRNQHIIDISLHAMHITLLLAVIFNSFYQIGNKQYGRLVLTLVPAVLLLAALVASFFNITASGVGMLVYDFYIIYYFFFLCIQEFRQDTRRRCSYR